MKNKMKLTFGIIAVFTAMIFIACRDNPADITTINTAVKPTAMPTGGNYAEAQTVTLSTATSGAAIYYTIDGTEPTVNSDKYSGQVLINQTSMLKAIAVKAGMNKSEVMSENYIITPPGQVVQPVASPTGGNYEAAQTVTLTTETPGAVIYYTLDENTPTIESNEYSEPINIKHTATLKAIAVKSDMNNSAVLTEHYIITPPGQVVQPAASPEGGNFTTTQTVTLSTITEDAIIYYTLDESEPTTASNQYDSDSPITIEHTATIKAFAVKTDMHDSDIMIEEYIITPPGQVVQPAANIHSGTYFGNQTVTLSSETVGAIIYYTLNGIEPTAASALYSSSINITETTTLKAIAVKTDMHDSDVLTVNYTIIGFPLTNLDDIALYLDMHTGTSQHPINLPVAIELGTMTAAGSDWRNLLNIIAQADEFVNLDLSSCVMNGTEFNPDYSVVTGKNKIISITLPNSAESIKDGTSPFDSAFLNFTVLKSFHGDGLKSIGVAAFFGSTSLDMTSLPAGITLIDDAAFYGCTNLALTSLPEGVTSIGESAFDECTYLALTSLPEGVIYIGGGAFFDCRNLALTSLPEKITVINNQVFYNCKELALTSLPEGITSIGRHAFNGCDNLALTSLPENITIINEGAFYGCKNLVLDSLPEKIVTIERAAFYRCESLTFTSLPAGVTSIGDSAFAYCTNLALTSLPANITSINLAAFQYCENLAITSFPAGVISIGDSAFLGGKGLVNITLPASITSVGASAFNQCTNIEVITCLAVTPPTLGNTAFNNNANMQIKVPAGSVEAYKSASTWSLYASKIIGITP